MSQFPPDEPWRPSLDWSTPSGKLLEKFATSLAAVGSPTITVFGSAPLQLALEPGLLSADVDVFSDTNLQAEIDQFNAQLQGGIYLQFCSELNFVTSPRWKDRAHTETIGQCTLRFPHPIDILIGKLQRLEPKDLEAFRCVVEKTGHPTETELLHELQASVDMYRPSFDEETGTNVAYNTAQLWETLFGHSIDVREAIIKPALKRRKQGFDEPTRDLKGQLAELGASKHEP